MKVLPFEASLSYPSKPITKLPGGGIDGGPVGPVYFLGGVGAMANESNEGNA